MFKTIRSWLHRIKAWVEGFADKPHAIPVLAGLALVEASVFPVPPDVLLIAIAGVSRRKAFPAAAWCTAGSAVGGVLGYVIGFGFMAAVGNAIIDLYGAQHHWERVVAAYQGEIGVWFLAIAAFTPVPYKVATIAAGATEMPAGPFVLVSVLGRGARFFLIAALLYTLGPQIRAFIDRHFDKLSLAFAVLLVGGFIVLSFLR
jgi:membrane protein YqaA with SNARE-associated domain